MRVPIRACRRSGLRGRADRHSPVPCSARISANRSVSADIGAALRSFAPCSRRQRPLDGELGVVPRDRQVLGRLVRPVDPVRRVRRLGQRLEAVRAARRDVDRVLWVPSSSKLPVRYAGEPGRRSTTTSNMAPEEQRTSFASPCARRTCRPRITPYGGSETGCPAGIGRVDAGPRATAASNVRVKKPRSSRAGSGVNTTSPGRRSARIHASPVRSCFVSVV